jgi:hypothetical protein
MKLTTGRWFTDAEKQKCAEREVAMRRRVYPNRVQRNLMLQEQSDKEIAMMQEIADDYRKKQELPL